MLVSKKILHSDHLANSSRILKLETRVSFQSGEEGADGDKALQYSEFGLQYQFQKLGLNITYLILNLHAEVPETAGSVADMF